MDHLEEPRVITSQAAQTDQQTSIFNRLLWFVEQCFLTFLQMNYYQANYQLMVLITLLTNEWRLGLFFSVIITNVYEGASQVSVVLTSWLADIYLANRWVLLISAFLYSLGLALWCFTIPTFRWFCFFPGLLLIFWGQCGHVCYHLKRRDQRVQLRDRQEGNNNGNEEQGQNASLYSNNGQEQGLELEEISNNQERGRDEEHGIQERDIDPSFISHDGTSENFSFCISITKALVKKIKIYLTYILGLIIAIILFPAGKDGFIILIEIFVAMFIILSIMRKLRHNYSSEEIERSPFSIIFNVYILAFTKRNDDTRNNIIYKGEFDAANQQFYNNTEHRDCFLTHNNRFLDRAALYDPSKVDPSILFEQGRLYTFQQVEDTKRFENAMRLSLVFLMYGVMSAVGETFFLEQADKMDSQIGKYKVPIQMFVMTSELVRKLVSYIYMKILPKVVQKSCRRRFYGALRVGIGMLLSVPCFGIAWYIEKKRLANVNVSAFWLTPQLILVGLMDGLAVDGVKCYFKQELPNSIGVLYGSILTEGIVGLGKLLSVGWFCFWYFITNIGDNSGWFGHDINNSRLDYYYAIMVGFGLVSTLIYACVVTKHAYSQQSRHN